MQLITNFWFRALLCINSRPLKNFLFELVLCVSSAVAPNWEYSYSSGVRNKFQGIRSFLINFYRRF